MSESYNVAVRNKKYILRHISKKCKTKEYEIWCCTMTAQRSDGYEIRDPSTCKPFKCQLK